MHALACLLKDPCLSAATPPLPPFLTVGHCNTLPHGQVWFDPLTRRKFYSENTYLAFARWVLGWLAAGLGWLCALQAVGSDAAL